MYLSIMPPVYFGTNAKQKKDLLDLTSISPSDPFMGHLGICAYDLIGQTTISLNRPQLSKL